MGYTQSEVLQYVKDNDVRFIKLFFTDIFGHLRSINIQPQELEQSFKTGIPFDASEVRGFFNMSYSDLFLIPDPSTLCVLPWRPQQGRVVRFFCNIKYPDGSAFEGDTRAMLSQAVSKAEAAGFECSFGTKCEFYLFKRDLDGNPTREPHDRAGYCDLAPLDAGENIRREICLTLSKMGIEPLFSYHEAGPGQHEVDFRSAKGVEAADNLNTFKTVVRTVASNNGLFASFLPKPVDNAVGSGFYVNLSIKKDGKNIFEGGTFSETGGAFVAGILNRIVEIATFLNPLPSSYYRLGHNDAPLSVSWTRQNRLGQLIRLPFPAGEDEHIEVRAADPSCNPYLAIALLLRAGLEGVENKETIIPAAEDLRAEASWTYGTLPENAESARKAAAKSKFVKSVLPEEIVKAYTEFKAEEPEFGTV
ncbi:MAG: glutamine synthetase [Spirochaetaceae bacterium]|nr:glutamine synthetase [Spirochaetaceae bacterium]